MTTPTNLPETATITLEALLPGDLVDLESCPFLRSHHSAPYEYARVAAKTLEGSTIVVSYEGIDSVAYSPTTQLTILVPSPPLSTAIGDWLDDETLEYKNTAAIDSDGGFDRFCDIIRSNAVEDDISFTDEELIVAARRAWLFVLEDGNY